MSTAPSEAQRFREAEEASRDAQTMRTMCSLCDWKFEGTAVACRTKAAAHRAKAHPEISPRSRHRKSRNALHTFRTVEMHGEDKMEIEAARTRRARLHGIEIED
jgi:hypothetical protein